MDTEEIDTRGRRGLRPVVVAMLLLVIVGLAIVVWARVGATPADGGEIELAMESYAFDRSSVEVPVGEPVTMRFVNRDQVSHHLTFGRTVLEEDDRMVAFREDLFAGLSPSVRPSNAVVALDPPQDGFTVLVQGGSTVTIDVTFPDERAGTWEIGCFTGRGCHYQAGLHAELILR